MKLFDYDSKIEQTVGLAHRRPALRLDLPALTRHLAFWPHRDRDPLAQNTHEKYVAKRAEWASQLNCLIEALQSKEFARVEAPFVDLFSIAGVKRGDQSRYSDRILKPHEAVIGFPIRWRGFDGDVQIELSAEYATFSISLYCHERAQTAPSAEFEAPSPDDAADVAKLKECASRFDPEAITAAYRRIVAQGGWTAWADDEAMTIDGDQLFDALWAAFDLDLARVAAAHGAARNPANGPGFVFVDLRGVCFVEGGALEFDRAAEPVRLTDEQARQLLNRHRPFFSQALAGGDHREREFVANGFLDGGCVFVSTLGSFRRRGDLTEAELSAIDGDSLHAFDQYNTRTIRYFLIFPASPARAEFGRLIERLHAIETLRAAALRDFDAIFQASHEIRYLGRELDDLEQQSVTTLKPAMVADIAIRTEGVGDRVAAVGGQAVGGLSFRISRATLYVEIIERRIEEFQVLPVRTWQPYDEFLLHRVRQVFDFIGRVADRRAALMKRVGAQFAVVQTARLVELTKSSHELEQLASESASARDSITYAASMIALAALGVNASAGIPFDALGVDLQSQSWLSKEIAGGLLGFAIGGVFSLFHYFFVRPRRLSRMEARR